MKIISVIETDFGGQMMPPIVEAMQNDVNTRIVEAHLFDAGTPLVPADVYAPVLLFGRADGTGGAYDTLPDGSPAFARDENVVSVTLPPATLAVPGQVDCSIAFINADGHRLATFPFTLRVTPDPSAKKSDGGSYFKVIAFVRTVNGSAPDETGDVRVASTCELEQPVWGKIVGDKTETKELLRLSHDGRNGWAKPMSASEYSALMAKATSAALYGGDVPVMDVPLSDIVHTSYDYDPSEGHVPCIILSDVGAYSSYSDCYLVIEGEEPVVLGFTQIPGEYTGLGDIASALNHIIALQEAVMG